VASFILFDVVVAVLEASFTINRSIESHPLTRTSEQSCTSTLFYRIPSRRTSRSSFVRGPCNSSPLPLLSPVLQIGAPLFISLGNLIVGVVLLIMVRRVLKTLEIPFSQHVRRSVAIQPQARKIKKIGRRLQISSLATIMGVGAFALMG
jgi:hypothetical protein